MKAAMIMLIVSPSSERYAQALVLPQLVAEEEPVVAAGRPAPGRRLGVTRHHIGAVFDVGMIVDEASGQIVTGRRREIRADQAIAEAQRLVLHLAQHDIAENIAELERVDIAPRGEG